MMPSLEINPPNTAMVDSRGLPTPPWYRFFVEIVRRIGGASDPTDDTFLQSSGMNSQSLEMPGLSVDAALSDHAMAEIDGIRALISAVVAENNPDDLMFPPTY